MRISDLNYLELMPEETDIIGGAEVAVGVFGEANGKFTSAIARTNTYAQSLPYGGSIAVGVGVVVTWAFTPPSPPVWSKFY